MDRTAVLIAAATGRALAASARRGGFTPLVADWFADQDLIAVAHSHRRLKSGLAAGMRPHEVLGALASLASGRRPVGVVCGTGFEDRPGLLAEIARRWTLIGNGAELVARVKDPKALAALCRDCGIPHPTTCLDRPADPNGWLMKRRGGAGGRHVNGEFGRGRRAGRYFQRRVAGTPVSASLLANGHRAIVLGFSAQWPSPTPHQPFRYGGAVAPANLAPQIEERLNEAIRRLVAALPLVGLNSVDFLVDEDAYWLLEINPRPGATFDILEPAEGSLFLLHVDACRGALPELAPARKAAKAAAIVYAENDIPFAPPCHWPEWTADRPAVGMAIAAGEPLCTVTAVAATAGQAKRLVARRGEAILSRLGQRAA